MRSGWPTTPEGRPRWPAGGSTLCLPPAWGTGGLLPTSCAGPSELGRRVSATRRWPLPIWPVLWALEGPCAQPASSTAAEATGQASPLPLWATLVSSGEPEEAVGCSGQPPAPCPPGSLVPCLAGTHRSMSGTGHPADGSTGLPSTACGASSGSGSESALLSGLLLSSLLELHRRLRGRRRPRHRRRRFCGEKAHWRPLYLRACEEGRRQARLQGAGGARRPCQEHALLGACPPERTPGQVSPPSPLRRGAGARYQTTPFSPQRLHLPPSSRLPMTLTDPTGAGPSDFR